jgi:hypothetical protein
MSIWLGAAPEWNYLAECRSFWPVAGGRRRGGHRAVAGDHGLALTVLAALVLIVVGVADIVLRSGYERRSVRWAAQIARQHSGALRVVWCGSFGTCGTRR